jgi:hypothetical protein
MKEKKAKSENETTQKTRLGNPRYASSHVRVQFKTWIFKAVGGFGGGGRGV